MITKDDFVGRIDDTFFFNPPNDDILSWSRTDGKLAWLANDSFTDYTDFSVIDDKLFFLVTEGGNPGGEPLYVRSIEPATMDYLTYGNPAFVDAYADWFA